MMNRKLLTLASVAVVLGLGAYFATQETAVRHMPRLNGQPVVPNLDVSAVAGVEFGSGLKLASGENGWTVATYHNYPADRAKLAEALMKLAELKVGQVVRGKTLENATDLVLRAADGSELAKLSLGEKHAKWGHGRYAAFKGETVLVSDALDAFEGNGKSFVETKIVDTPYISFTDVVEGLSEEELGFSTGVVAKVTIAGETNRLVTVGNVVKGCSSRYLRIDRGDWVYTVPSYAVESILLKPEEKSEAKPEEKSEAKAEAEAAAETEAKPATQPTAKAEPAPEVKAESKVATKAVTVRDWGTTKNGEKAHLYTLTGVDGLKLVISDFGGRLVRCYAPDRKGDLADVTPGWETVAEYEKLGFSIGTLIGRFGNRIKEGKFTLDGTEYHLPINEVTPSPRHGNLHSGPDGWDTKVWQAAVAEGETPRLVLTLVSPDGDMGFPGTVTMKVTYSVLPGNVWRVEYEGTTDKATVINPTHHSYWNLAGVGSGNVLNQLLKINADTYTKTDAQLIPTEDAPVKGTGFDFTELRPIGAQEDWMKAQKDLAPMDNWYDHNFVIRGKMGELRQAVEMVDPVSGRALEIWTTEPCLQMYGAQNMTDDLPGKDGKNLCPFAAIALETQHYPDSPNHLEFPSTVLRPGETFRSVTEYRFSVR